MSEPTLEILAERIAALERRFASLQSVSAAKNWHDSVGLFDDDPDFDREVLAEGRAIREAERNAAIRGDDLDEPTIIEKPDH